MGEDMATKSFSIRIKGELLDKLHVVADYNGRSANGQMCILVRNCIREYEQEQGEILLGGKQKALPHKEKQS